MEILRRHMVVLTAVSTNKYLHTGLGELGIHRIMHVFYPFIDEVEIYLRPGFESRLSQPMNSGSAAV